MRVELKNGSKQEVLDSFLETQGVGWGSRRRGSLSLCGPLRNENLLPKLFVTLDMNRRYR